jgi:hypothetical protein
MKIANAGPITMGPDGTDQVDIRATKGEYILPPEVVAVIGKDKLDQLVMEVTGQQPGPVPVETNPQPAIARPGYAGGGLLGMTKDLMGKKDMAAQFRGVVEDKMGYKAGGAVSTIFGPAGAMTKEELRAAAQAKYAQDTKVAADAVKASPKAPSLAGRVIQGAARVGGAVLRGGSGAAMALTPTNNTPNQQEEMAQMKQFALPDNPAMASMTPEERGLAIQGSGDRNAAARAVASGAGAIIARTAQQNANPVSIPDFGNQAIADNWPGRVKPVTQEEIAPATDTAAPPLAAAAPTRSPSRGGGIMVLDETGAYDLSGRRKSSMDEFVANRPKIARGDIGLSPDFDGVRGSFDITQEGGVQVIRAAPTQQKVLGTKTGSTSSSSRAEDGTSSSQESSFSRPVVTSEQIYNPRDPAIEANRLKAEELKNERLASFSERIANEDIPFGLNSKVAQKATELAEIAGADPNRVAALYKQKLAQWEVESKKASLFGKAKPPTIEQLFTLDAELDKAFGLGQ